MIETEIRDEARVRAREAGSRGERTALVPTMGYLHRGHLSLVDRALDAADWVAVSIFVNPTQFGPDEDLDDYPRDRERDLELLRERGVSLAFTPGVEEMYPDGDPVVRVEPGELADRLCGRYRPGHFEGVLTVVAKLFGIFRPDVAVFGRKDFQQGVLIRRMVRDLDMGVDVRLAPIVREEDGLAMSSRNLYLSEEERADALALHRGLFAARRRFRAGERDAGALEATIREALEAAPRVRPQYVEIVDPGTLEPVTRVDPGDVAALAAFVGDARLIDNVVLE